MSELIEALEREKRRLDEARARCLLALWDTPPDRIEALIEDAKRKRDEEQKGRKP